MAYQALKSITFKIIYMKTNVHLYCLASTCSCSPVHHGRTELPGRRIIYREAYYDQPYLGDFSFFGKTNHLFFNLSFLLAETSLTGIPESACL